MSEQNGKEQVAKCLSRSVEDFSVDFQKNVAGKTEGNLVSSTLSAHVVLSMAAYGAEGKTAAEMRRSLRLPEDDQLAFQGFHSFIDDLNNVTQVILKLANKIYVSNDIIVKDKFKEITSKYFHSESAVLNFSKSEESAAIINQWCNEKTNSKIKEILKPEDLNEETGMVLVNAVYFKGNWKDKFNKDLTKLKSFHINKTTTIDVPTMFIKKKFYFKEFDQLNVDIVALPYENKDLSMLIIVPREIDGLENVEKNLEKIDLDLENELRYNHTQVCLSLPKFKIESTIDLSKHLKDLGMVDMFGNDANFSGISDRLIKVDKAIQKAVIEVNEEGSEAAAATGLRIMLCSMPPPPVVLDVNRPFLYRIVHAKMNITLFSGRVSQPNA